MFFPGNNGFPVSTSANMQPMLHMSIAGVYYKINSKSKSDYEKEKKQKYRCFADAKETTQLR